MAKKHPRGSEWRKWDLHVHTPASYDWDKKCKVSNEDIVDAALKEGISAIAVTDHHTVKAVDDMKALGTKKGLFVIPGVELRTDKGNEKIHIIALFEHSVTGKFIYDKLLCPLGFSEDDVKKASDEQVYCSFEGACKKIHELGGLVFLHAGSKSNGIEQIRSDIKSLLKTDMARMVDLYEVTNQKSVDAYRSIVFPTIKKDIPCVVTSDSVDRSKLTYGGHSTEVLGKANTWIKADLSFEGLRHILVEPKDRVCLGAEPPKFADLQSHPTKYIERVAVGPLSSSTSPSWFKNDIPLNQELVAVIGRKGSGKSALVDVIALCGKSHVPTEHYSFLKPQKFRKNPANAKKYTATINWLDTEAVSMGLADEVPTTDVERVKYLPQSYVETICNEDGVSKKFQQEIDKVIFSYVPQGKRIGATTLQELIQKRTEAIDVAVGQLREDIEAANQKVIDLEKKKASSYKTRIEKELAEKENEHKSIKDPTPVKEPSSKLPQEQQERLQKIDDSLTALEKEITQAEEQQTTTANALSFVSRFEGQLASFETAKTKLISEFEKEAKALGIDLNEVIQIVVKKKALETKKAAWEKQQVTLDEKLNKTSNDVKKSLFARKAGLEKEREDITKSLDDQNKKYREYQAAKKRAEAARSAIMGRKGDKSLKTILSLKAELAYITDTLLDDLKRAVTARKTLVKKLYEAIVSRIALYKDIYQPLLDFIESEKAEQERSGNVLTFDAGIVFNKSEFADAFLAFVNQARDGSFQKKEAGSKRLKDILAKYDLQDAESAVNMIEELLHNLHHDTTQSPIKENTIEDQVNTKHGGVIDVYNFLHQLPYLDVQFKILFNGKDLNQNEFSPGEKGALLLIFYLLIDNDRMPLIMDQPEENLDNESVYSLLVPYIKRAKERRQVIIVTHNPNLAVVCDAEQVICATMDKKKNEIRYESGSIEDPETNKRIVDILEGTMPAFSKRDDKYLR